MLKDSPEQIGDIKITKRTDLDDNWKLCDGSVIRVQGNNTALSVFGDNGVCVLPDNMNLHPTFTGLNSNNMLLRGLFVVNGYLVSVLGTTPEYFDEKSSTFKSLDNLKGLSTYMAGSGIWYANNYYFYAIQQSNGTGQLYYSSDLFGTFTKLSGVSSVVLNVGYVNNQYIFLTRRGMNYSSDLSIFNFADNSFSGYDADYAMFSTDLSIKDGYIYRIYSHRGEDYWRLYRWKLPLTNSSEAELVNDMSSSTSAANSYPMNLFLGDNYFIANVRDNSNYVCKAFSYDSNTVLTNFNSSSNFFVKDNLLYGISETGGDVRVTELNSEWSGKSSYTIFEPNGFDVDVAPFCVYKNKLLVVFQKSNSTSMNIYEVNFFKNSIKLPIVSIGVNSYIKIK